MRALIEPPADITTTTLKWPPATGRGSGKDAWQAIAYDLHQANENLGACIEDQRQEIEELKAEKSAARIMKAKEAHDSLIADVHRSQAHALAIRARAEMRLAEEYDAAQERGEVRSANTGRSASALEAPSANDVGLSQGRTRPNIRREGCTDRACARQRTRHP